MQPVERDDGERGPRPVPGVVEHQADDVLDLLVGALDRAGPRSEYADPVDPVQPHGVGPLHQRRPGSGPACGSAAPRLVQVGGDRGRERGDPGRDRPVRRVQGHRRPAVAARRPRATHRRAPRRTGAGRRPRRPRCPARSPAPSGPGRRSGPGRSGRRPRGRPAAGPGAADIGPAAGRRGRRGTRGPGADPRPGPVRRRDRARELGAGDGRPAPVRRDRTRRFAGRHRAEPPADGGAARVVPAGLGAGGGARGGRRGAAGRAVAGRGRAGPDAGGLPRRGAARLRHAAGAAGSGQRRGCPRTGRDRDREHRARGAARRHSGARACAQPARDIARGGDAQPPACRPDPRCGAPRAWPAPPGGGVLRRRRGPSRSSSWRPRTPGGWCATPWCSPSGTAGRRTAGCCTSSVRSARRLGPRSCSRR